MDVMRFVVYSDYICPWCFNADVRLRALEREYEGRVTLDFRSYLLRPRPRRKPEDAAGAEAALEKFRAYTKSWMRPAAEDESGSFRVWQGDEGPPSHSIPPHLVAKAAARLGAPAFEEIHEALLLAYFRDNRDITDDAVLRAIWSDAGLDPACFDAREDPALLEEVLAQHEEAQRFGATGVPAVRLDGNDAVIVGAHPAELYRRWIERTWQRREAAEGA